MMQSCKPWSDVDREPDDAKNQELVEVIRSFITEDKARVLTAKQIEENGFLKQVIDEHRDRKLFG